MRKAPGMSNLPAKRFCLVVIIGILSVSYGCDGGIRIKGKVFAKTSAAGDSEAFIDEAHPVGSDLISPGDATIIIFGHKDYSNTRPDKIKDRKDEGKTDKDGSFVVDGGLTSPYRFKAALIVEKDGYKPLTKIFLHDKIEHEAFIILVPKEQ